MKTKLCSKCKRNLPLSHFNMSRVTKDGLRTRCRKCRTADQRDYRSRNRDKVRKSDKIRMRKYRLTTHWKKWSKTHGKQYYKKNKKRQLQKQAMFRKNHPAKARRINFRANLKRKGYGITFDNYMLMLKKQNGRCAICGRKEKIRHYLSVDHDHQTGKVRGLLCTPCNAGIAFLGDSFDRIESAFNYMKSTNE